MVLFLCRSGAFFCSVMPDLIRYPDQTLIPASTWTPRQARSDPAWACSALFVMFRYAQHPSRLTRLRPFDKLRVTTKTSKTNYV